MRRRFMLWLVLLVQAGFIFCYWLLMQVSNNSTVSDGPADGQTHVDKANSNHSYRSEAFVNFIRSANELATRSQQTDSKTQDTATRIASYFAKDFYASAENTRLKLNQGAAVDIIALWCFREGTLNVSTPGEHSCRCQPEWHGRDCGQPEVIWRSLMTAKRPFALLNPSATRSPHRLVLMIPGSFYSDELLELQLQTLANVVDEFLIFVWRTDAQLQQLRAIERRLAESLSSEQYLILHCTNNSARLGWRLLSIHDNCTTSRAFAVYLSHTRHLPAASDLLLYAESEYTLVSRPALTFLKYYAGADMPLLRFRLKHNVYGFYWQHPQRTQLGGILSSFAQVQHPQLGNSDPEQLLQLSERQETLVIGDLNHFGGWYCKYCQQPEEIIATLHAQHQSPNSGALALHESGLRNGQIDAAYLQKLIANGIYLDDSQTQLRRLRPQTEKYFAPTYAEQRGWRFGHLLINLYERLDEDTFEDEGAY